MGTLARFDSEIASSSEAARARQVRLSAAVQSIVKRDRDRSLSSLIESEIIPRLMIAHSVDVPSVAAAVEAGDVEALAPLALEVGADRLLEQVESVLARGVSIAAVMVDLLAPTARMLGEYWEDDRCDFVDVTMGLWRLQEVVHEIAGRLPGERLRAAGGRRALFASMPGDQHDFGTVVVDELFRGDGWVTDRLSGAETPDLLAAVGRDWFDLVGLTVSRDCHIEPLPAIIAALRNVSRNPRLCIMVGGRVFGADAELATRVGADGTARDARLALQVAVNLVRARTEECLVRN